MDHEHEVMQADVVIVGAGPAGLAAAYRLAERYEAHNRAVESGATAGEKLELENVFVLEKGAAVGSHQLSGAVLDPIGMRELVPDFESAGFPVEKRVESEKVFFLRPGGRIGFPITPPPMRNHGNLIVSLSDVVKWLAARVEEKGVNVLPGFPAARVVYDERGNVAGIRSGDMGLAADGTRKSNFEPGTEIRAKVTIFAEGPRGNLVKELTRKLDLTDVGAEVAARYGFTRGRANPQVYACGLKEIWKLTRAAYDALPWDVVHTMGHPLPSHTFGGSWLYKMKGDHVSIGFVVGLDSPDPRLDPHGYFQLWKAHPFVRGILDGATLVRYGAKTISEGGWFSVPKLAFANAMIAGESGGLVNVPRLKGIHYALKSGALAAEQAFEAVVSGDASEAALKRYEHRVREHRGPESWLGRELHRYRRAKANFAGGFWSGLVKSAVQEVTGGWWPGGQPALRPDHAHAKKVAEWSGETAQAMWKRSGEKIDNERLFFDRLTGVYNSGTVHEEDQPCHLVIAREDVASICNDRCTREYGNPCQWFCPASVYEMVEGANGASPELKLNPSNCVHCKTCDIRDPYEVITWVTPEGGGGPEYARM